MVALTTRGIHINVKVNAKDVASSKALTTGATSNMVLFLSLNSSRRAEHIILCDFEGIKRNWAVTLGYAPLIRIKSARGV